MYTHGQDGVSVDGSLFQKRSDGSQARELLYEFKGMYFATSWSPDGSRLLIQGGSAGGVGSADLYLFSLASRKPEPLIKTEFSERQAIFSPNGQYVAFTSNSTGRDEIYFAFGRSAGLPGMTLLVRDDSCW
jgi:TolB protein